MVLLGPAAAALVGVISVFSLRRHLGVQLQMGGSDQWGNIINGVELVRRVEHKAAFALTTPLLTTSCYALRSSTARLAPTRPCSAGARRTGIFDSATSGW